MKIIYGGLPGRKSYFEERFMATELDDELRALAQQFAAIQETINGLEYDRLKVAAAAEKATRERDIIADRLKGRVGSNIRTRAIKVKDGEKVVRIQWNEPGKVEVTMEDLL